MTDRAGNPDDQRNESATGRVAARPEDVFDLITDVRRLPEWNVQIPRVLHAPARLTEGAEWVVVQRGIAPGLQWNSRARVIELDRAGLRFGYRSCSDDGNPSYATWTWQLSPADGETKVSVQRELHPETFWRRVLFSRIRHRQLRSELRTSIEAMQRVLAIRRETR